ASSSKKLSTTKTLWVGPTPRQKAVGMPGGSTRNIVDMNVRESVGRLRRALHRIGVETVLEERWHIAREDRSTAHTVCPGHRLAIRVEPGRQSVIVVGPVHVVLDVFLAAPDDFHRSVHLLRDLDSEDRTVRLEPPAEAAA